ncbi:hypothetical protein CEXT_240841 [Caerostris extrusa]|uniref:Uncharacterized protein n=1 Tax=Caerostris extrusa TaxID=172846 RepID=A0AAV4XEU7_CAEEX|nr:hypothetical protein CEXT_240841 [Caerostris extrusa]
MGRFPSTSVFMALELMRPIHSARVLSWKQGTRSLKGKPQRAVSITLDLRNVLFTRLVKAACHGQEEKGRSTIHRSPPQIPQLINN